MRGIGNGVVRDHIVVVVDHVNAVFPLVRRPGPSGRESGLHSHFDDGREVFPLGRGDDFHLAHDPTIVLQPNVPNGMGDALVLGPTISGVIEFPEELAGLGLLAKTANLALQNVPGIQAIVRRDGIGASEFAPKDDLAALATLRKSTRIELKMVDEKLYSIRGKRRRHSTFRFQPTSSVRCRPSR